MSPFILPLAMRRHPVWSSEAFCKAACDLVADEVDWDSVDSGRFTYATSAARTMDGAPVIVGVLDRSEALGRMLEDAEAERVSEGEGWSAAPLWLYVPAGLPLDDVPADAVVRRVPFR